MKNKWTNETRNISDQRKQVTKTGGGLPAIPKATTEDESVLSLLSRVASFHKNLS